MLICRSKLLLACPRNFSQRRPPVPTSRSSHSPRACILACARRSVKRNQFCAAACCRYLTLPSFNSSRPSAQTTPQKCREQSDEPNARPQQVLSGAGRDLAEILCVDSLHKTLYGVIEGSFRIGLIFGGGGCERACKCAARRAGAASVEFDRNLCGSIFYAIYLLIISMPFWRDRSANGVGSVYLILTSEFHSIHLYVFWQ